MSDGVEKCRYFSVIVDGTQDASGTEQQSICLRYQDDDFCVHEEFVGFFEPSSTTGAALAHMISDALCRLGLPISKLRGMAFDGAANMSGKTGGAQAILRERQPAALFVHCGAHCVNLVARDCTDGSTLIRNALQTVNEVGSLFSQSIKFREQFTTIRSEEGKDAHKLRPLCPTRWTVRLSAVEAMISQYDDVMRALEDISSGSSSISVRASGLHSQLGKESTLIALHLARLVLSPLDRLGRKLQGRSCSVSDLLENVRGTIRLLHTQRDQAKALVISLRQKVDQSRCEQPIQLPRQRRAPARFFEGTELTAPSTVNDFLEQQLAEVVDRACMQLTQRFDQDGVREHAKMEALLLGQHDACSVAAQLHRSPWAADLSAADLSPQLQVVFRDRRPESLQDAVKIMQEVPEPARAMFPEVNKLLQLLLTLPASSATAERSFSALRRLKTWLRSTMCQVRLTSVAVCHVHRHRVDAVDADKLAAQFVSLNAGRERVFGRQ